MDKHIHVLHMYYIHKFQLAIVLAFAAVAFGAPQNYYGPRPLYGYRQRYGQNPSRTAPKPTGLFQKFAI